MHVRLRSGCRRSGSASPAWPCLFDAPSHGSVPGLTTALSCPLRHTSRHRRSLGAPTRAPSLTELAFLATADQHRDRDMLQERGMLFHCRSDSNRRTQVDLRATAVDPRARRSTRRPPGLDDSCAGSLRRYRSCASAVCPAIVQKRAQCARPWTVLQPQRESVRLPSPRLHQPRVTVKRERPPRPGTPVRSSRMRNPPR
jgi:hypothetical protein